MAGVRELVPAIGSAAACRSLGVWRGQPAREQARQHHLAFMGPRRTRTPRPRPPLALAPCEKQTLLDTLYSERFCDSAPASVYATLLDEGVYLGSVRTMYPPVPTAYTTVPIAVTIASGHVAGIPPVTFAGTSVTIPESPVTLVRNTHLSSKQNATLH